MVYDIICVKKYSLTQSSQICDDTKCVKKMLLELLHLSWLVYFLPITLLWQWHVRVYKETFSVNIKIAQTMQNIWNSACEQTAWLFGILLSEIQVYWRNGKLRGLSGRFHTLIWRPGNTVQNLESPRLSRRVNSTDNWMLFEL